VTAARRKHAPKDSLKNVFVMSTSFIQSTLGQSAQAFSAAKAKPLILIAEDSLDGREMMSALLRLKGYDVVVAEDGVQAIDMALKNSPDLIFIDLELPRLDGISVARNIRRSRKLCGVPIIVVSGHDPAGHREAAIAAGCTDYLMKPIDFDRLDAILELNVAIAG
jgi:two-component system, cell cycle response regulator DivK